MANDKETVINLDLSLCLRPPKNVLESADNEVVDLFRKREEQAIRRREAKIKRDLKRKGSGGGDGDGDGEVWGNGRRKSENVRWLGNCGNNRCSVSSGSSDDNYCSNNSAPGGHSSDTSSHSSQPHLHLPASDIQTPTSSLKQPTSSRQQDTPNYSNQRHPLTNSISPTKSPEFKIPSNASKEANSPKPNGQTKRQGSESMPKMPCVTTTGNGPKGKTITGFLYKYTKTEVSIVCVCHGAPFSPAGFVEHAGGVDVEHPLRHIRVASFPLA